MIGSCIVMLVLLCGLVGGFFNALSQGDIKLPRHHKRAHVFVPGLLRDLAMGVMGALIFYGIYGPLSRVPLIGQAPEVKMLFTFGDLVGAIVAGIMGGRILTAEIDKRLQWVSMDNLHGFTEDIKGTGGDDARNRGEKRTR